MIMNLDDPYNSNMGNSALISPQVSSSGHSATSSATSSSSSSSSSTMLTSSSGVVTVARNGGGGEDFSGVVSVHNSNSGSLISSNSGSNSGNGVGNDDSKSSNRSSSSSGGGVNNTSFSSSGGGGGGGGGHGTSDIPVVSSSNGISNNINVGSSSGSSSSSSSSSSGEDARDKFQVFEDWLVASGSSFQKLYLKEYGVDIRGCHTKVPIQADEQLIHIPLRCLITVEMGKECKFGKAIIASNVELDVPKHIFLMVYMLEDIKNENSCFKPYYDILPKKMKNMPIFWDDHELKYLEGSYLLFQIRERYNAIVDDYNKITKAVPSFASLATLEEFMMARMCVSSRNFGVTIGNIRTAVMVPYADMLNHYRPRETKWQYDELAEGFTVVALKSILDGAQVFDSYGQKCNHRFLLNYGFSVENNTEPDGSCPNEVPILLELLHVDELFDFKQSAWRREGCFPNRKIRVAIGDNDNTRLMFSMLRVIMADREDIDDIAKRNSLGDGQGYALGASQHGGNSNWRSLLDTQYPINFKNELRAMARLQFICEEYLSYYPTTFQQDCKSLADTEEMPMYSNKRNACIQIRGEKEILLFYRGLSTILIDLINILTSKDRERIDQIDAIAREMCHDQHMFLYSFVKQQLAQLSRCHF